jgi:hypothetical protein
VLRALTGLHAAFQVGLDRCHACLQSIPIGSTVRMLQNNVSAARTDLVQDQP